MDRLRFLVLSLALIFAMPALAQDGPEITFLAGDAARAAIVDESVEPYFSLLCLHEMQVKSGQDIAGDTLDTQREAFKVIYAENTREFSEDEKAVVTTVIEYVDEYLREHYPRMAAYPWSFIKVTHAVEQGLPHTREGSIVLPEGLLQWMVQDDSMDSVMEQIVLMLHEQLHVVQRAEPETFLSFYQQQWGLEHVESIESHPWLVHRQLINPDGVDVHWVQNVGTEDAPRYIQPNMIIARFDDRQSRMPQDFQMVAVEVREGDDGAWQTVVGDDGLPVVADLLDEQGYMVHYSRTSNVYGPNESLADLFARQVFGFHFSKDAVTPEARERFAEELAEVLIFFRESFAEVEGE